MKKFSLFLVLVIIFSSVTYLFGQSDNNEKVLGLVKEFHLKILGRHDIGNSGLSLNILVRKSTSKEDVLKIAKKIRSTFPGKILDVSIFDSEESFKNRNNDKYPDSKYFRHYLVQMNVNPHTGFNEIKWMKK